MTISRIVNMIRPALTCACYVAPRRSIIGWTLGIGCMLSGVWWLVFSVYAFARLPERPGPPLPPGGNLLSMGWIRTYRLLAHVAKNQPQTGWSGGDGGEGGVRVGVRRAQIKLTHRHNYLMSPEF